MLLKCLIYSFYKAKSRNFSSDLKKSTLKLSVFTGVRNKRVFRRYKQNCPQYRSSRNTGNTMPKGANIIPYLRTENLKNHTLSRGTYLYSPYMGVPPPPPPGGASTVIVLAIHTRLMQQSLQPHTCATVYKLESHLSRLCYVLASHDSNEDLKYRTRKSVDCFLCVLRRLYMPLFGLVPYTILKDRHKRKLGVNKSQISLRSKRSLASGVLCDACE